MPQTTETATFDRPVDEVFRYLADFDNLEEWDPTFESSRRLDEGPLGVGSRFHAVASIAGRETPMELEIVEYDQPHHVVLRGEGEGFRTREDIRVEPRSNGSEVTYVSEIETDRSALAEAVMKPGFALMGKAVMRRMRTQLEG